MGEQQAREMAELLDLEAAISWHLGYNHYPPVPQEMVEVCIEAIMAAREGDWASEIALPDGVTYQDRCAVEVWIIVKSFHLDPWVQAD